MKKEEILKLAEKMGMNKEAMENQIKADIKVAEEIVTNAAKFIDAI